MYRSNTDEGVENADVELGRPETRFERRDIPQLDCVQSDDDSDDGDGPHDAGRAPYGAGCVERPIFRYHAVVNTAVEQQLIDLLVSPATLYCIVSQPYTVGTLPNGQQVQYREVYMHLTVPMEAVRVCMPGVPNIGYVWGEFHPGFDVDAGFHHALTEHYNQVGAGVMKPADV